MAYERPAAFLCDLSPRSMPGCGSRITRNGNFSTDALSQLSRACRRARCRYLVRPITQASCEHCADESSRRGLPPMKRPLREASGWGEGSPQLNMNEDDQLRRGWKNELKQGRLHVLDLLKKERAARKRGDNKKMQKYSDELTLQLAVNTADWDWFDLAEAQMKCMPKELSKWAYGPTIWALVMYWEQCAAEENKWREIAEIASLERTGELSGPWELMKEHLTPETCRAEHRLRELRGRQRGAEIERWMFGIFRKGGKDAAFLANKIAIAIAKQEKLNHSKRGTLTLQERGALLDYRSDLKYS